MSPFTIFDLLGDLGIVGFITTAVAALPRILLALVVFLIFWAYKGKLASSCGKLLHRLLNHKKTWIDKEKIDSAMVPCRSVFALLGVYLALSILGLSSNPFILHILRIAVIALIAWILVRFWDGCAELLFDANKLIGNQLSVNLSKTFMSFLSMAVKVIIIIFAALAILAETGVDVTALVTGLGLGGLTFALAAQDTASNLFAGLVILLDHPFDVDDFIETPDVSGTVQEITFRSTKIRTVLGTTVVIPNNSLSSKAITNYSRMETRRITSTLGLRYGTTSEQMNRCVERITEMLSNEPDVKSDDICVNFDNFGDSGLNINIAYSSTQPGLAASLKIKENINLKIMNIIEEEGCSYARPARSVFVQTVDSQKNNDKKD